MTAATKEAGLAPASTRLTLHDVTKLLDELGPRDKQQLAPVSSQPRPCRCDHPLGFAYEWLGTAWIRCLLCGRTIEEVTHG